MAKIALSVVGASAAGDVAGYRRTDHGAVVDLLEARGHEVVDVGIPGATHFVAMDHNRHAFAAIEHSIPRERRVLVVFEPRVVLPANYSPTIQGRYGAVVGMTPVLHNGWETGFLDWPQRDWRALPKKQVDRVPGTTALVNANKLSSIKGSLYGLRRRVIQAFSDQGVPLTLAGPNWLRKGRPLVVENLRAVAYAVANRQAVDLREWATALHLSAGVSHLGRVDDKDEVLLASEFSVVIENSATYVSEKLFDAVITGTVPLYTGPPFASFGIPDGVAVRMGTSASDFPDATRTLSASRKADVLAAGREWLASDEAYNRWAMPAALDRLASTIDSHATGNGSTP